MSCLSAVKTLKHVTLTSDRRRAVPLSYIDTSFILLYFVRDEACKISALRPSHHMKSDTVKKFEKIYEEHSDAIFRFCLSRVSNREQALDITQETFLRLWQSLSGEKEIINEKSFLFTITHHLIIDWYRKKKSISLESIMAKEENSEYDVIDDKTIDVFGFAAEGRYLLEMINQLTPSYRQPVYLRYVEDLPPKEIGDILGISENAASVRVNRGIIALRKISGYNDSNKGFKK